VPSTRAAFKRIQFVQAIAFALVVAIIWTNEILDIPHHLLGAPATPVNWREALLATGLILVLTAFVLRTTQQILSRMERLEALLPICSRCKKIRDAQGRWIPVESYIHERTSSQFTHSICPDCERDYCSEAGHGD